MPVLILFVFLLFSAGCTAVDPETAPLVLKPADFRSLPGWTEDDHAQALAAFERSCARIMKRDPAGAFGPDGIGGAYGPWQDICRAIPAVNPDQARTFFETHFRPWRATMAGKRDEGLFTGYYEPTLNGATTRHGPYQTPLYARPDDLVMVDLGLFRDSLKGQRIAGRVEGAHLKPYEDRAAIAAGNWPNGDKVLAWVDDPVGAFFLHVQGSGRINLADGRVMRVGYDGQNGHPYFAIGRELIARGDIPKEEVSLQTIRAWLAAHPEQAQDLMNLNPSYVFFRELTGAGPLGGEGVALTPERSLAIDRGKIPYGVPVWLDLEPPVAKEPPVQSLMIAQDTGGAIRGAVRGDVFWGAGPRAEYLAGYMKAPGKMWLLLPKNETPGTGF
ncbi:MAG: murein transglycosylase A [Alphaproteobacteria bacterium]|nr:murein transglycosylase A [Alphaproteobacteria bacterium]